MMQVGESVVEERAQIHYETSRRVTSCQLAARRGEVSDMKTIVGSLILATAALAAPAAAVTIVEGGANSGPVDVTSRYSGYTLYAFDDGSSPFTGGAVRSVSSANNYVPPYGDSTPYFAVGPSTSSPATFAFSGVDQLSFYWGSIDTYNSITFLGLGLTYTGAQFETMFAGANRNAHEVTFQFNPVEASALTGVALSSGTNSFELDNFIVGSAVPEPATYAIFSLGLGVIGASLRRRRHRQPAGRVLA